MPQALTRDDRRHSASRRSRAGAELEEAKQDIARPLVQAFCDWIGAGVRE